MNLILSIKPEYVTEIEERRKRFEFRKAIFKQKVGKVYIYAGLGHDVDIFDVVDDGVGGTE